MSTKTTNTFDGIPESIARIAMCLEHSLIQMTSDIYTGEQLSLKLNISLRTLYRWRKEGKLHYSKIGKQVFYTHEDVMKMLGRYHALNNTTNYFS